MQHTQTSKLKRQKAKGHWYTSRGRTGILVVILIVGILLLMIANLLGLSISRPAPSAAFTVRIAPFSVEGGDERTGAIVAEQLRNELAARLQQGANLDLLRQPITTPEAAAQLARDSGAEIIIWGTALAGGSATSPSLRPQLTWMPNEPWVPRTWQGYDAHLVMPQHFELASTQINGAAVLPMLIDSLHLFSRGEADLALDKLSILERDYGDVLRPELPATLRATAYWAQGLVTTAAAEAQRALASSPTAPYWSNVGALALDQQQNNAARDALLQAVALDPALIAPRTNLGRLYMNLDQPADALPDLRTAAATDTRPVVLAALAEALRRAGRLEDARTILNEVLLLEPENGPALTERATLALINDATTPGQLEWELEYSPDRTLEQLAEIRAQAEKGIAEIEQLHGDYLQRATAYGVDKRPVMQRLMETQAQRLQEELLNRRYQRLLVMIEQGRLDQMRERSAFSRLWEAWRGQTSPLVEAAQQADATLQQGPGGLLQYETQYQRGRIAYLQNDKALARQAWDAALALTTTGSPSGTLAARPEAHYGRARLLVEENQRDEAWSELEQAVAADARYFPARELMIKLAKENGRLAEVEPHLRWLDQNRPTPDITFDLATSLRQQGRNEEAEAILLPLANNADLQSLTLLGRLYRESGQLDAAANALDKALALDPNAADALEEQARVALARPTPDYAAAETLLRRAVTSKPEQISAHIELGKLLANVLGRPGEAVDSLEAAVALKKDDPLLYRELGEAALESGALDLAVESFENAIKLQPNSHEAYHGLASAYLAQGQLDQATAAELKTLELTNNNYTLSLVGLGDIALERGDYEEAIKHYDAALERDPDLISAYLGLGSVAVERSDWTIAQGHYQRGLERQPDNVALLVALGHAQLSSGDAAGALASFGRAKELAPDNAAAYAGAGQALWKSGQTDAAMNELNEATLRNPSDAESLIAIGEIHEKLGNTQAALDTYGRAAAARPTWHDPHYRRGVLLLRQQQIDLAIEELETVTQQNDNLADGHYWLGRAYRAAERYADAARELRRAVEIQSDYYEAQYFLGRTLDEQGAGADAIATYNTIIAQAPPNDHWRAEAARELERIR